ncbi:uncharacterized protein LOC108676679 [Hyalella azteca]|uniref:Uncharacterized protein LOC108676679 n=1 Tax=Hyalella azteca TaxID=294128 RepID=A0A8B7P2N9_HYAAZ|nr:uncharacterized protein LOC108676679 [Hyalella azteca]XP_047737702.1 uncharacterized protein LOC108676679 [Hyalella azteca]
MPVTGRGAGGPLGPAPSGVIATRYYQSGPPAALLTDDDGEVFETVKEEEVVHKRRKATTTTKNIERRTQRDLLLEDGRVVGDSGPTVTEDVTEDTQVKETFADENLKPEGQTDAVALLPPGEGWVAVPGSLVTSEKVERYVNSRQEHQHSRETEQHAHYGDVTNDEVERYKGNVGRLSLAARERKAAAGKEVALSDPRLVSETSRKWGVVDTEDVRETSRVKDGHVITETHRTTQQEQYDHGSAPDSSSSISDGSVHEEGHKAQHHIVHTKDEDILEYYAVPKGGTLAQGVKLGEGMHVVSEDVQEDREGDNLETLGASLLRHGPPPREDALTKKPLDYVKEEKQRQDETTRWLEHHFGSDSGRSHESAEEIGGNRILITMSPHPASPPPTPPPSQLRRWGPMASTPNNVRNDSTPKAPSPLKTSNFSVPPPPPMPHQISEARSRLRSTGRTLDEIDSSRDINAGRVRQESFNFSQNSGSAAFTPPVSPTSPKSYNTTYANDRYQSMEPSGRYQPSTANGRYDSPQSNGEYDPRESNSRHKSAVSSSRFQSFESNDRYEAPPPKPARKPEESRCNRDTERVGRSQSFHTSAVERDARTDNQDQTWKANRSRSPEPAAPPRQTKNRPLAGLFSTLQSSSKKKANRAAKIFDSSWMHKNDNDKEEKSKSRKSKKSLDNTDDQLKTTRQYREKENDRPFSAMETSYRDNGKNGSTYFSAKMASKLLHPVTTNGFSDSLSTETPVPPPRTKRRPRPQTSYYFGQQPEIRVTSNKPRPNSIYANVNYSRDSSNKLDDGHRESNKFSTYQNRSSSNGRVFENDYKYNDYNKSNQSRSRSESHPKNKYSDFEMNRKNESFNHRSDSRLSNVRDHSNDRYDSGYGERQDNYGTQQYEFDRYEYDTNGRKSSESRRHPEKYTRRLNEEKKYASRKSSKEEKRGSPVLERRYKTTKTITPVFVMESKQPKQYRSMDLLNDSERNTSPDRNSSWTQTLEPRRRPADESRMSSTLPRKVHQSTYTLPSKTYVYGHGDGHNVNRNFNGGSLLNVTSADYQHQPSRELYNGSVNKNVLRSQSLNVRPVTNLSNLRSPNLIASIARSNSTRRPETMSTENLLSREAYEREEAEPPFAPRSQVNTQTDERKSRFMEGLLNTAPELFHFMHGDGEDVVDNKKRTTSPPRLMRPDPSSPSPLSPNPPKVFTFGREGGNTLRRGSSGSGNDLNSSTSNLNKTTFGNSRHSSGYDSGTYSTNGIKARNNLDGSRRQSTFNMKTEGGSLLYSPSFRERSQQMMQKKLQMQEDAKMAGKRAGLSTDHSPILINVRDWSSR